MRNASFRETDDRAAILAAHYRGKARFALLLSLLCGILSMSGCIGLTGASNSSNPLKPAAGASISVSPAAVSFGTVAVGGTVSESVTVSNPTASNVSVTQASTEATGFTIPGTSLPLTIAPGQQATLNIMFSPKHVGAVSGTVSVMSNASSAPNTVVVSGTGVSTQTLLDANTPNLNFGNLSAGTAKTLSVDLTNAGNSNVTISKIKVAGEKFTARGLSSGLILAPGQNATLDVTFSAPTAGTLRGRVTVVSNAANSPAVIDLSGAAVSYSSHSVALTWQPDPSASFGYNVYRSTAANGPYAKVNSPVVTVTAFTDSAVQGGQIYYYVVTAVDSAGVESSPSTLVSAAIPDR
jgi:P pilus assembly chaperone PapD